MKRLVVLAFLLLVGCKFTITTVESKKSSRKKIPPRPVGYDTAYLVKGEEVRGRLLSMDRNEVVFLDVYGKENRWKRGEVQRVEFQKLRKGYEAKTVAELKDHLLEEVLKRKVKKEEYPNARYVVLYETAKVNFKGGRVEVRRRFIAQVMQDAGRYRVGNRALWYLPDRCSVEILWARTVLPNGTLKHIDDSAIEDGAVYPTLTDYNLLRKRKFALSEMSVGAVADVCTKEVYEKVSTLTPFYIRFLMGGVEPILYKEVVLEYEKTEPLKAVLIRRGDGTVAVEKVEEENRILERFSVANVKPIEEETDMPPYSEIVPSIVVSVDGGDWVSLGKRYATEIKEAFVEDDMLRKKASQLTDDLKNDEDKAKALYRYVVCEKDYVDVGLNKWKYRPHPAAWSLRQGRLNSLDKAVLFVTMANLTGIDSRLLLVRKRSEGAFTKEAVSLGAFSDALVLCKIDGRDVYLALRTPETPFGHIPSDIQGGVALLVSEKDARLFELPVLPPSAEVFERTIDASMDSDGTYKAKVRLLVKGSGEVVWRKKATLKPEELRREMIEMLKRMDTRAVLDSMRLRHLDDPTEPLEIEYEYHITSWALRAGKKLLVFKLPEINYTAWELEKEKRVNPLWWKRKRLLRNRYSIRIPKGYRIRYLPEKTFKAGDGAISYEACFRKERDKKITFTDKTERRTLLLEASQYSEYVSILTTQAKVAQEWIIVEAE